MSFMKLIVLSNVKQIDIIKTMGNKMKGSECSSICDGKTYI